jgi:hypothetical protein
MNVEIGTMAEQFLFWNICFKFSVLFLCRVTELGYPIVDIGEFLLIELGYC